MNGPLRNEELRRRASSLMELYEPIFERVCFLNRAGRRVGTQEYQADYQTTRDELRLLLRRISEKARNNDHLIRQAEKLERPVVFFIDSMIARSRLDIAPRWREKLLAVEMYQEAGGNERFFDLLNQTLDDPGDDASERLSVFYTCLGLGFTGKYKDDPNRLQALMERLQPRVKQLLLLEAELTEKICPDAYPDPANQIDVKGQKESRTMVILGILFACFTITVMIIAKKMFNDAAEDLTQSVSEILRQGSP